VRRPRCDGLRQRQATRQRANAPRLGLDVSNFLPMVLFDQIGVYERRADRIEGGEPGEGE
jgi:hypothetical protein